MNIIKKILEITSVVVDWLIKLLTLVGNILIDVVLGVFSRISKILRSLFRVRIKPKKRKGRPPKKLRFFGRLPNKILIFIAGFVFSITFIFVPYEVYSWFKELPNPNMVMSEVGRRPTRIYDRNENLLYEIFVEKKYAPVKLSEVPEIVKQATIAVEDSEFYNHRGFRVLSMVRAAYETFLEGTLRGGSTITQQLIKNVLLTPERTFSRKLKELVLSILVETKYTKDEIFELYLNNISYGGTAWGIQSAAQKYFGKNVWELNLAEASMIAGLPSAPSTYSPLTDISLAKDRQKHVLSRMYLLGYITKKEAESSSEEELFFIQQGEFIKAPHFVHFVRAELEKMYGRRFVEYGGLNVTTTLDMGLQDKVQQIVREEIANNSRLNLTNGAVVVVDAPSSGILAHVGSVDYYEEGWGAFDVVTAYRQPGSSIKPVTYSLALSKGFSAATIIQDSPITYQSPGSIPYSPVNYDGKYHGSVTLRSALANSYNVPAVRLAKALGPDNIVSLGKEMGLTNWEVDGSYGLAITLGGKEVSLMDLTNVYATLARGGNYRKISPFISIKDSGNNEIFNIKSIEATRIISPEASYLIWSILSDNKARTPMFGSRSSLVIPNYSVAVKTGTTDEKRDNWTMGFTPKYAVGVWVGNNDNTPMNRYLASGLTGASPIWNRVFSTVLEGEPNIEPERPAGIFTKVDSECGVTEYFIKGSNVPDRLCVSEKDKDDDDKKNKNKKKN